jgi:hypothetical protein
LSTNDFICAKRAVIPFSTQKAGENINVAAEFLVTIHDQHINLNNRAIEVIKNIETTKQSDLVDQFSTFTSGARTTMGRSSTAYDVSFDDVDRCETS